jgi:hypothetical protein
VKLAPDKIGDLLRLKRYEQPTSEYFDDFVREFRARQRDELLRRGSVSMAWGRVSDWLRDLGSVRWAYAAGVSYALLLLGLFFWPHGDERVSDPSSFAPVRTERIEVPLKAPVDAGDGLDLRATGDELREQEF